MSTAPSRPAPPPPPKAAPPKAAASAAAEFSGEFQVSQGRNKSVGTKTVVYGTGGCGKSSLFANLTNIGIRPLFFDLDDGTKYLDVDRVNIGDWSMLRAAVQRKALWEKYDAVIVDDLTKAEEFAAAHVVATVKNSKGAFVSSIEDYGWGDGYGYLYHEFLKLLGDLDAVARAGKHIGCVAHDATAQVPNPAGENFLRFEPRLQSPKSGKDSVRSRVKEWCDHLFYIGYDRIVEDGKATGGGSRAIYTNELPMCLAKSRTLTGQITYEQGSSKVWEMMFEQDQGE
jgi:hypothetical protein